MKNFIKRLKELKPEQKRKLAEEMTCIAIAILGVVILVLNLLKIAPTNNSLIAYGIAFIIGYGFLLGPCMILLGMGGFFETRNISVRKFRKKAR